MNISQRFKVYSTMVPNRKVIGIKTESVALIEIHEDGVTIPKVFAPNPGYREDMFEGKVYPGPEEAITAIADAYDHREIAGRANW